MIDVLFEKIKVKVNENNQRLLDDEIFLPIRTKHFVSQQPLNFTKINKKIKNRFCV